MAYMLTWASTHNATLLDIAISHANKTRDNHIREDGSTFHVCDYSGDHGELYLCRTGKIPLDKRRSET